MRKLLAIYRIATVVILSVTLVVTSLPHTYAAGVVNTCDESSLNAALAGVEVITFACSGTINVTLPIFIDVDTAIDARGQNVTIAGGMGAIFSVTGTNNLTIYNLSLTNARVGAITGGGTLTIYNSYFSNNYALTGGAVSGGTINVYDSTFVNNGSDLGGGAIAGSNVTVINSHFYNNRNDYGWGGAIWSAGALTVVGSTFANNIAAAGEGRGAAIYQETFSGAVANISSSNFLNNDCQGNMIDNGGNRVNNATGCPGEYSDFSDLTLETAPPQCQETVDSSYAAPVGTYCQVIVRDGQLLGIPGSIPTELVDAGIIIALEVVYYDQPGHAAQAFADGGNQQVCLQGEGRFIYLDATQSPRQIVEMNSVYESGYTCAWIPHPGTVVLIEG